MRITHATSVKSTAASQVTTIGNRVRADLRGGSPTTTLVTNALSLTQGFRVTIDNDLPTSSLSGLPFVQAGGGQTLPKSSTKLAGLVDPGSPRSTNGWIPESERKRGQP